MSSTYETMSQTEGARRKKLLKFGAMIFIIFILIIFVIWFLVTQPVLAKNGANSNINVDAAMLEKHVKIISNDIFPRDEAHPENLDKVAAYIHQEFAQTTGTVSEQPFKAGGKNYKNVILQLGPDTKERIVVGAHYDACDPLPAADDNASGVAGLIELAKLLDKTRLPMRVELVAYTLEEPPYFDTVNMGSAVHAAKLKQDGVEVRLMISLEMIGYFSDEANSQDYPISLLNLWYPSKGNFITVIGNLGESLFIRRIKRAMIEATPLPVYSMNAPASVPGIDFSDHLNYWNEGYHAVMISDTAFYRNKNYHTSKDTYEKLNYQKMAQVVQGVYAAIINIAQ